MHWRPRPISNGMEKKETLDKTGIHGVLVYAYSMYLLALILGLMINFIYPSTVLSGDHSMAGMLLLVLGTLLIFWAQYTSGSTHKVREEKKDIEDITHHFKKGPYAFTRSPTYIGLGLVVAGFGLTMNSGAVFILSVAAYLVCRYVFTRKEEQILEAKYGESYRKYKKAVWF